MEEFYKYILCTYSVDACTMDLGVQLSVCCEEVREHVQPAVLFIFYALSVGEGGLGDSIEKLLFVCVVS